MEELPAKYSCWHHHGSGKMYVVVMITNQYTTQPDRFPVTVVYYDSMDPTKVWSRPLEEFLKSMTRLVPIGG